MYELPKWKHTVILLVAAAVLGGALGSHYKREMDFRMFYSAAQMVRHGAGAELYDIAAQQKFQASFTNYVGLVFNYPPATAILYLPTTLGTVGTGYLIWTALNLILLLLSASLLQPKRGVLGDSYYFAIFMLAFGPAVIALVQGQITAVVLALYCAALVFLRRGTRVLAGVSLGLALIKPQLAVPILAIIILQRRWKIVSGYLLGAASVIAVSVVVSGWRTLMMYPSFLRHMAAMPMTGINPRMMATVRALYVYIRGSEPPLLVILGISALLVILAARFSFESDTGFSIAVVTTLLVAYHLNLHDLLPMAIPLTILVTNVETLSARAAVLFALWAAPLQMLLWAAKYFPLLTLELFVVLLLLILQYTGNRQEPKPSALSSRRATKPMAVSA